MAITARPTAPAAQDVREEAEEGMIVFAWRLLAVRVGIDHCSGQNAYSWSYELITNIPGEAGRRPW
ncbi:hypothetical protein [Streptomyces sp. NPDC046712]|uniref:hypothetical protein n=1 Tax=Streptomyces sp. NPDC046712 TaxID=3154802 RepID=UPI0033D3EE75